MVLTREELIAFIQAHDKYYVGETMDRYKDDLLMKMAAKIKAIQKKNEPAAAKKAKPVKVKKEKIKKEKKKAKKEKKKVKTAKKKSKPAKQKAGKKKKKK